MPVKISRKRLFQIDMPLSDAVRETLERFVPDIAQRPPEDWNEREKAAFDAVTEAESALSRKLKELFTTK